MNLDLNGMISGGFPNYSFMQQRPGEIANITTNAL